MQDVIRRYTDFFFILWRFILYQVFWHRKSEESEVQSNVFVGSRDIRDVLAEEQMQMKKNILSRQTVFTSFMKYFLCKFIHDISYNSMSKELRAQLFPRGLLNPDPIKMHLTYHKQRKEKKEDQEKSVWKNI